MADDKAVRPAPDQNAPASKHDRTTAAGEVDSLATMQLAAATITSGPPLMPTAAAAAVPITSAPPPMPMAATITSGPPLMPTAAAAAVPIPSGPPPMPTAAAVVSIPSGPPPMPTAAAVVSIPSGPPPMPDTAAPGATAAPTMPTAAAAPITSSPPPMPGPSAAKSATAAPTMPTLAGAALDTAPPAMPTMAGAAAPQHLPPAMPPARYKLGLEIARGGMGRVVDATDTMLGRVVAFKEALTSDDDALRRFQREIRITARLEHPSIVPVHDTGESSNGAPFYVMRKVSGQPLERLVANAETLNQRLALIPHIVDSAQAIAHAHERGIVHRDIKPSNILVGELGETVVIDWGLAKVIGEPDEPTGKPLVDLSDSLKTRVGIVYGTPGFMAPEQLRGVPVTEGFDVYALGATLYHLLSRKPPHYAKTADEMMKAAVSAPPTPIRELVDGVPPELSTIVDKALAHDPQVRYQNARELAVDLQRFLTGQLVASHHYSPREKVLRFIRKNRGVSIAVAALLVVGTISVIRIIVERNRARAAEAYAIQEGREKELRAEQLTLALARSNVEVNPTKSVAMLKPLAGKYWREVRATAAAARAAGVAWSLPASNQTRSLELSHDGLRVLSVSSDGDVRIHDLGKRTTQPIVELHTPVDGARFADGDRQIVLWHDTALMLLDAGTGKRRDVKAPQPIVDLEVVSTTAYWVDKQHALWQFELSGTEPTEVPLQVPVNAVAPSPDGRWIALTSDDHLFLYDRTQPDARLRQVAAGDARDLQWSPSGDHLAALIAHSATDQEAYDVAMMPEPRNVQNVTMPLQPGGSRQAAPASWYVAACGGRLYAVGWSGVLIAARDGQVNPRQIRGDAVGVVESRGGTVVAGAAGGLTVISEDGDHVLPLQAARVESVLASPRSPYVIAQLADRLLVWNLDDLQPRRLTDELPNGALFATGDQVITGGTGGMDETPTQSINAVTGAAQPLGDWQGLRAVTAPPGGQIVAVIDGARHVHLVGQGRTPEDLPGEIDIAAFATPDKLVLTTPDGAIYVHDVERHQRTPLGPHASPLIGLAWGHGHHPWIAAAFIDGTLWRKNLVTGVEATIPRVPKLDHVTQRDGKLIIGDDGTVLFLHDSGVHAWRADGAIELLAKTPKLIDDFGETGTSDIIAVANDSTIYAIAREGRNQITEALPSIDGTSASMSPDTGLLVVLDHGAIDVVDPLAHQQWTLAPPGGVTFSPPVISADGRRVLAQADPGVPTLPKHLLVWSLGLPEGPDATMKWLDAMTNAVDDLSPRGLGWR